MNTINQTALVVHSQNPAGCSHDYDLVRELIQRQQVFRRCDQYISNPEFKGELQDFWDAIKSREHQNLERLKELVGGQTRELPFRLSDL